MRIYTYEADGGSIQSDICGELQKIFSLASATIPIEFIAVSREQSQEIETWNGASDLCTHVLDIFGWDSTSYRLLISAGDCSQLKRYCLSLNDHAYWGVQFGHVAVEYVRPDLKMVTQIHECLHFFDVGDCYIEDHQGHPPKQSCKNERCLMRYGVESREVCSDVLAQLKNRQ